MSQSVGRWVGAMFGSAAFFVLYAFLVPLAVMAITLYLVRLFPLTGQWRNRLVARWRRSFGPFDRG